MNTIELDFRAVDALETQSGATLHPGRNILEAEVWEKVKTEPLVRYRIDQGILKVIEEIPATILDSAPSAITENESESFVIPNVIRTDPADDSTETTDLGTDPHEEPRE